MLVLSRRQQCLEPGAATVRSGPKLLICILVPQLVGITAGLATASSVRGWYGELIKPPFNPPDWLFAPVWTALYLAMGIAAYLVWRRGADVPGATAALVAFVIQLALNWVWSFLFFGLRSPLLGLIEIVLLWGAIVVTMVLFFRRSTWAGALLVPYLLWVSFAMVLNFELWRLNA
jgi:benzodiazapine receptor